MKKFTGALLLVGSGTDCPDLRYASGFRAVDPVVYLQHGRKRWLVVPEMELGRAVRESEQALQGKPGQAQQPHVTVLSPGMLDLTDSKRNRLSEWALAVLREAGVRRVAVPRQFPVGVARRLERGGIRVADVLATDLFPQRAVKNAVELKKIRESQQAAVIAMRAAVEMIARAEIHRSGLLRLKSDWLTSEDVRRAIQKTLVEHGCFCEDVIVAGGPQSTDPHEVGSGPLRAHEAIVMDIFPQHLSHAYWGDISRTVVRGAAPPQLKKMYAAVRAAQTAALNAIRPGARQAFVHRCAAGELRRRGFETGAREGKVFGFTHSTGHGVGLAIHEGPSLSASSEGRLRKGHVVTVEPGLYYPDIGGIRIEDLVVVTEHGWQYMVPCEKRFEL